MAGVAWGAAAGDSGGPAACAASTDRETTNVPKLYIAENGEESVYEIFDDEVSLGRGAANDVQIHGSAASKMHAVIRKLQGHGGRRPAPSAPPPAPRRSGSRSEPSPACGSDTGW